MYMILLLVQTIGTKTNWFPEIKDISLSTIYRAITIKLQYSYGKEIYINYRTNVEDVKLYWFYYYKMLIEYISQEYILISLDETGVNKNIFRDIREVKLVVETLMSKLTLAII